MSRRVADETALLLDSKPDVSTLARFNASCLPQQYLHAFKVLEKPLPFAKQDRHYAEL